MEADDTPDAALIAACEQYIRHLQDMDPEGIDSEMQEMYRLEGIILPLRATTLAGLRAKARAVIASLDPTEVREGVISGFVQPFALSVLRDLTDT